MVFEATGFCEPGSAAMGDFPLSTRAPGRSRCSYARSLWRSQSGPPTTCLPLESFCCSPQARGARLWPDSYAEGGDAMTGTSTRRAITSVPDS